MSVIIQTRLPPNCCAVDLIHDCYDCYAAHAIVTSKCFAYCLAKFVI